MKQKSALLLTLLALFISSCTINPGQQEDGWMVTTAIRTMESRDMASGKTRVFEYKYLDYNPSNKTLLNYEGQVRLAQIDITGDTISKIEYSYPKEKVMTITTTGAKGVSSQTLQLNDNNMVDGIINGQTVDPYWISYFKESNSAFPAIFRATVKDTSFTIQNNNYTAMRVSDQEVARFEYTDYRNYIGLQQFGIAGEPYSWVTDNFGRQSENLIRAAYIMENGEEVRYEFRYRLDNYTGFVAEEAITRNGAPFRENKYNYISFKKELE